MGDSAYSFSLTTFSPSGKLVQIEYALNAVASGATSLGVKGARRSRPHHTLMAHSPAACIARCCCTEQSAGGATRAHALLRALLPASWQPKMVW